MQIPSLAERPGSLSHSLRARPEAVSGLRKAIRCKLPGYSLSSRPPRGPKSAVRGAEKQIPHREVCPSPQPQSQARSRLLCCWRPRKANSLSSSTPIHYRLQDRPEVCWDRCKDQCSSQQPKQHTDLWQVKAWQKDFWIDLHCSPRESLCKLSEHLSNSGLDLCFCTMQLHQI